MQEKTGDVTWLGTVVHLRPQLYLQTFYFLCNSAWQIIIAILGSVRQAVTLAVKPCPIVFFDQPDNGYRLIQQMGPSVVACADRMTTAVAPHAGETCQTRCQISPSVNFMPISHVGGNKMSCCDHDGYDGAPPATQSPRIF